ncbi:hypothetical protein ACKGJI_01825 [Sulfurospirillum sp. 1307]|jgi:Ca2+-binding EF-hand superfamily protein
MKKYIFSSLVALMFAQLLSAQQGNMATFNDFDLNSDGIVDAKEFDTAKTNRMIKNANEGKMMKNAGNSLTFEDIDANHDGKFDKGEFLIAKQNHMRQMKQNQNKNRGNKGKNNKF